MKAWMSPLRRWFILALWDFSLFLQCLSKWESTQNGKRCLHLVRRSFAHNPLHVCLALDFLWILIASSVLLPLKPAVFFAFAIFWEDAHHCLYEVGWKSHFLLASLCTGWCYQWNLLVEGDAWRVDLWRADHCQSNHSFEKSRNTFVVICEWLLTSYVRLSLLLALPPGTFRAEQCSWRTP